MNIHARFYFRQGGLEKVLLALRPSVSLTKAISITREIFADSNQQAASALIEEWFSCYESDRALPELPVHASFSSFQRRVFDEAVKIPRGTTWSYSELACAIGCPQAARAVGRALGSNPLPLVIPCHRVIGKSGALTGFREGIEVKRLFLRLERHAVNDVVSHRI